MKRAGPLVEYERRIEAGDLEDGDNSQVIRISGYVCKMSKTVFTIGKLAKNQCFIFAIGSMGK